VSEDLRPDVEIACSVRAREIRFEIVPETKVWFDGEPGVESSVHSERENLPDEVEPGVTYRDVRVRWWAQARIAHPTDPDVDRLGR
jgi:hypothetical protein